jgi:hypothetical protein
MSNSNVATSPASDSVAKNGGANRDQVLSDIRAGRRLERITSSVQNFLETQVAKIDEALEQCEAAVENDRLVRDRLAAFEKEKREWETARNAELKRLSVASDELAKAWEKLETDRRSLADKK